MNTNRNDPTQPTFDKSAGDMSEVEVDENLEESFPASDPPSWTLGSNHRPDVKREPEDDEQKHA